MPKTAEKVKGETFLFHLIFGTFEIIYVNIFFLCTMK